MKTLSKILFIFLLMSLIQTSCFGQSLYEDGIQLRRYISGKKFSDIQGKDGWINILAKYYNLNTASADLKLVRNQIIKLSRHTNPFLYEFLKDIDTNSGALAASVPIGFQPLLNAAFSNIGGLDMTNMADGFARFVVKRTKAELNAAFFEKLKEEISKPEFADLQTVFPQTYNAMIAIGKDIYQYNAYLNTLRECFEKDLANLPSNLPTILTNHKTFFDAHPELQAILSSGFYLSDQLLDQQHPGNIIANYPDELWKTANPAYQSAFQTLKIISGSFRSGNSEIGYWISPGEFQQFYKDDILFKLYLGLLLQEAKNKTTSEAGTFRLDDYLKTNYNNIDSRLIVYKNFLRKFIDKTAKIDSKLLSLSTHNDSLQLENYYSFFNSIIDVLDYAGEIELLPGFPETIKFREKSKEYLKSAKISADLVIDVNRRNYASAVVDIYTQLNTIFPSNQLLTYSLGNASIDSDKLKRAFFKYGTLMASVSQAKSSEEVQQAIEAVTLPAGSARIKRETVSTISLNAFAGLYTGYEKIDGLDRESFKFNSFGVTAPVGIAISKGHSFLFVNTGEAGWKENKKGWSSSLFLSVIDIGAIAAFRFVNDSTESVPKIELRNIISPGIFLSLGIPKSPLSFNIGYQMGPLLRKVTVKDNAYNQSYSRLSLSFCVDIPILNFYSKPHD